MKVEIHIRDTQKTGKRIGMKNAFVESVRVYKEAGDGVRLDNLALVAQNYFAAKSVELIRIWRNVKTSASGSSSTFAKKVDNVHCDSGSCTDSRRPKSK